MRELGNFIETAEDLLRIRQMVQAKAEAGEPLRIELIIGDVLDESGKRVLTSALADLYASYGGKHIRIIRRDL